MSNIMRVKMESLETKYSKYHMIKNLFLITFSKTQLLQLHFRFEDIVNFQTRIVSVI